jgi:hypothetical protein
MSASLPTDAAARKSAPIAEGVLWYFPNALAAVAAVSKAGNDQHNPGQPMHHARGKSMDHADCILRHLIDAGTLDTDGLRHTAKVAWRALALLQEEIEREDGVPLPRNARPSFVPVEPTAASYYAEAQARLRFAAEREAKREAAQQATGRRIPVAHVYPYDTTLGGQPLPGGYMMADVEEPPLRAFTADEAKVGGTD